jgi:hypothetical protein
MAKLPGYRDTETCKENHQRFVKRVAANEIVWGLKNSKGWAYCESNDDENRVVLLFWSDEAYAKRAHDEEFADYSVSSIALFDFLFRWLPGMRDDGVLAGTNWTADLVGLEIDPSALSEEVIFELDPGVLKEYRNQLSNALKKTK